MICKHFPKGQESYFSDVYFMHVKNARIAQKFTILIKLKNLPSAKPAYIQIYPLLSHFSVKLLNSVVALHIFNC